MAKPDKTHEIVESNQSMMVIAELPSKKLVAVLVTADIYKHKLTGKLLLAVSENSKRELSNQKLSYAGMHMNYIPINP